MGWTEADLRARVQGRLADMPTAQPTRGGWTEEDLRLRRVIQQGSPYPLPPAKGSGRSKYNARKKELDGHVFDSTAEARRYTQLKEEQRLGLISDLELQPRFLLQAGFRDEAGKWVRKIEYVADFRYLRGGAEIAEDVKGMSTPLFLLKLKLFRAKYPKVRLDVLKGKQV